MQNQTPMGENQQQNINQPEQQVPSQTSIQGSAMNVPDQSEKKKSSKLLIILLILLVILSLAGLIWLGVNLLEKGSEKSKVNDSATSETTTITSSTTTTSEVTTTTAQTDPYEGWETCVYDDGSSKFSLRIPTTWSCNEEVDMYYSVSIESENFELYLGPLIEAACQEADGECEEEELHISDKFKLYRITNDFIEGPYTVTYGYFYKDGERLYGGGTGMILGEPDLQDRTLTQSEKEELFPVLDSITFLSE